MTRRSPRSTALHTGKGQELGGVCRQQQGRGSRLPREHDGQRCAGMPDRNRTSSACRKRGRCQPPLEGKLPPLNERGGRKSRLPKRSPHRAEPSNLDASFGGTTSERLVQTGIGCEDRKRFSCPKNVLLLYCRPPTWQVFPAFNERSETSSKPASTLVFLVFLSNLSTIVSAVGVSGSGSSPT